MRKTPGLPGAWFGEFLNLLINFFILHMKTHENLRSTYGPGFCVRTGGTTPPAAMTIRGKAGFKPLFPKSLWQN
jgi:hypothetical protein